MTIQTDKGEKISTLTKPEWSSYHQQFYVAGYRWIKTKQKFSSNCLLHSFKSYEEVGE
jgi:hypothetical protein